MSDFMTEIISLGTTAGGKLIYALVVLVIGLLLIRLVGKAMDKLSGFDKLDQTVARFLKSFIKSLLYVVLIISVIGVIGIPMASIVAVLASAGVAIGMSLQGALSNFAGGIMLMLFRPFRVGDYIEAVSVEGTVESVSVFYTVMTTVDNKRITVPNGTLMNANIINYSSEPKRRLDLDFRTAFGTDPALVKQLLLACAKGNPMVLDDPEPEALYTGCSDNSMNFTLRSWCNNGDYWTLKFRLLDAAAESFAANGIAAPATKIEVKTTQG